MKKLYRFHLDCGRMGDVTGLFTAEEKDVKAALGKHVYFGEILGKHSEIYCDLEEDHFEALTDDQEFIKKFEKFNCYSGHNPLTYLDEQEL